MVILLTIVHVIVCLFLVIVVLLQSGKAADLAGAFGGMGSQTVFGPRGSATVLSKATAIAAGLFMLTSLTLSLMSTRSGRSAPSILDKAKKAATPAQQKGAPTGAPGAIPPTVPITVETESGGVKSAPKTIEVPTIPADQVPQAPPQSKQKK
jgi:preprotein translocase subunit SecG